MPVQRNHWRAAATITGTTGNHVFVPFDFSEVTHSLTAMRLLPAFQSWFCAYIVFVADRLLSFARSIIERITKQTIYKVTAKKLRFRRPYVHVWRHGYDAFAVRSVASAARTAAFSVSYTHLTLPTIYSV